MAATTWTQHLDPVRLRQVLASQQGGVARDLLRRGLLVESAAKRNLSGVGGPKRIDTGRLRAAGHTELLLRNNKPAAVVAFPVFYAIFVHDGTGIYGPKGVPIRPRRRKFLRFKPRGSGKYAFARQVKGMAPNPFLRNALVYAKG